MSVPQADNSPSESESHGGKQDIALATNLDQNGNKEAEGQADAPEQELYLSKEEYRKIIRKLDLAIVPYCS